MSSILPSRVRCRIITCLGIAEDEDVAVAEVGFLNGFFESQGTHGDGVAGPNQMHFVVLATAG